VFPTAVGMNRLTTTQP